MSSCCRYFKKPAFASLLRKRDELCCPVDTCQQKFLGYAELFFHLFVYADGDASSSGHAYSEEHRYVLSNLAWQFACKAYTAHIHVVV